MFVASPNESPIASVLNAYCWLLKLKERDDKERDGEKGGAKVQSWLICFLK